MVSGSRNEGGTQVLSAGVRKTIQSIKEIVGNHSDADIYVALKETNMDPNETTQKLLNQDPFHEVKRKKDRKKENSGYKSYVAAEPRKNIDVPHMPLKYSNYSDHNARSGGTGQNATPDAGSSKEFRVVRDNRISRSVVRADSKLNQSSTPKSEGISSSGSTKSNVTEVSGLRKPPVGEHSSQAISNPTESQSQYNEDSTSRGNRSKETLGENHLPAPGSASRVQPKENDIRPHSTASGSSVIGVYSSSSDPVHVPSLHSRSSANVGAIRREVGVVGPRRRPAENSGRPLSSQSTTFRNNRSGRDSSLRELTRPFNSVHKTDQSGQNVATESSIPSLPVIRSVSGNQYGSRTNQHVGHPKATQPNKEWKPKSSKKPNTNGPGVIGSPAKDVSPPADIPEELKKEPDQVQDNLSQSNFSGYPNVIIASHIRVSDSDRCRLTFGSLGTELDAPTNSICTATVGAEELSTEPSGSISALTPESPGDEPSSSKQFEMEDSFQSSGSYASDAVSDHQLSEKKDSSGPQNLDNYADVGLVQDDRASYTPEQQQHTSEFPSFSGYDPQIGHDMSYFRPIVDETVPRLPSSQEVLTTHATNAITTSTIAMVQQQQQLAQMYPQVHLSHFANVMPYRQYLSPIYVPPMPLPGYSSSPAYPHPSNGGSYLVMPGNSSHGVKYGIQQFKPVPTGSSTVFGNFTSPTGYAINAPGGVGNAAGQDDSSRLKYKESLYIPNPQAETSEIWMNPSDLPAVQSASYYNMPGQAPHPAYLASHSGHTSFNAAAAPPSNAQYPGMYHPQQPTAMASHHHLGAAIGGNVGVGVASASAPGAQVGTYQQHQLGHLNWTGNF